MHDGTSAVIDVVVMDERRLFREQLEALLDEASDVVCLRDTPSDPDGVVVVVGRTSVRPIDLGFCAEVMMEDPESVVDLLAAIRAVAEQPKSRANAASARALSESDLLLLAAARSGLSSRQMAEDLGVSVRTVERRKQILFRKIGARTQAQAVAIAATLETAAG